MKKRMGILAALVLLSLVAVGYDAVWNESRIIRPIDASYQFRPGDLPLITAVILLTGYVIWLAVSAVVAGMKRRPGDSRKTRSVDPRLGWLGLCGIFGFLGIPAYCLQGQIWPFFFFSFFGFFGFFYEGKLSGTLMDERFQQDRSRAQLQAYKIGFRLMWLVTWLTCMAGSRLSPQVIAIIFTVGSSLIIALVLFLISHLLYRYDLEDDG